MARVVTLLGLGMGGRVFVWFWLALEWEFGLGWVVRYLGCPWGGTLTSKGVFSNFFVRGFL